MSFNNWNIEKGDYVSSQKDSKLEFERLRKRAKYKSIIWLIVYLIILAVVAHLIFS
ncbi:MAG: hypothetical protein KJ799_12655 [Bacteroidetes bacterium]|nr:hypothetical protein [Bacteroidota bacterium]MBU1680506.1 hypothetical protein [Bacteroidota bacterium]MBU2507554.1 hypothetical protein [Bacteroidota bacterium]